jgi:hypothetical protein
MGIVMMRTSACLGVWWLTGLTLACAGSPSQATGLGQSVTITYHSTVPVTLPWPVDLCGAPDADRRPVLLLNWTGSQVAMDRSVMDTARWQTTVRVPTNVRLDISVRDPGLCRMSYPPYGEFAWSGVAVNGTSLVAITSGTSNDRAPCFAFRVASDGEITLETYR